MPEDSAIERAIVLELLRGDHPERWCRAELERELSHVAPLRLNNALAALAAAGVVELAGEVLCASTAARRLDELGLIAV